jgi:hypothetical protein
MLLAAVSAALSVAGISTIALAASPPVDGAARQAGKDLPVHVPGGGSDGGGETIATATVIAALPFSDSDNTCGHVQDYVASCGANAAPDLFYRYTPASNATASLCLCGSSYDTILYVLENGVEIACNDDSCGLQSALVVPMVAGRTYTIGVSGFSTNCGSYVVNTCGTTPVEAVTWGALKSVYRGASE